MAGGKRIQALATEFNVGIQTIIDFLQGHGATEELKPTSKVTDEQYNMLAKEYNKDKEAKQEVESIPEITTKGKKDEIVSLQEESKIDGSKPTIQGPKILGKVDVSQFSSKRGDKKPQGNGPKPQGNGQNGKRDDRDRKRGNDNWQKRDNEQRQQPKPAPAPQQSAPTPAPVKAVSEQPKVTNVAEQKVETPAPQVREEEEVFRLEKTALTGPTVLGKIELPVEKSGDRGGKKKRQRIQKNGEKVDVSSKQTIDQVNSTLNKEKNKQRKEQQRQQQQQNPAAGGRKDKPKKDKVKNKEQRQEINEEDVQKQVKETLARLTAKGHKTTTSKHNRDKREAVRQRMEEENERLEEEKKILKVTEFVTASEFANMMNVPVNQVISTFMTLGMFVSINQRLDAETMSLVAEEFGYKVEFISVENAHEVEEEEDDEESLEERPPIVTVMGHVDHGKTSLLDYIRNTNVISGEAGGITQHIGAYSVTLDSGRHITFLDTPGHEAFTAMRARGAQVTDVAIIIIAADDSIMPQTIEAINHASAAGVPIVFAINKIDKPGANPDKIREALANMNYLVEEWGGQYQCQEISAKKGINVDKLLEKVLLVADLLELKANPSRSAMGNVIESSLDKGRGYVATLLVRNGTLKTGDMMVCGSYYGRVKAMFNERNQKVEQAGPSEPVLVLGLNGAPQAGEKFNVFADEKEAKDVANKRDQLQREFAMRAKPHITLEEIGRRKALGNFQELNVVVKGDVDGSVEALSDSLIKLSTEEIQVNVIHKAVGQISETDILLAAASNAVVVGFQVRPSAAARKLAEREKIDIRLYSIIYDAIEEIKSAMEGMLSPEIKEQVTGNLEIKETFKISKVGTIAGCFVNEGKVKSKSKVRIIRDGIVLHTGVLESLKRFKDDVKEVVAGLECGLNVQGFNDLQVGDVIEAYEEIEVARKL
ncbi:MAG: translation initiation factor IF-2 [Bacteroidales bacterium]|nr:translation initiation factor IF-2 [Bacteroidales bacterium]